MRQRKQGKCIFCSGYGLTKQHVWPAWLKSIIQTNQLSHSQFITQVNYLDFKNVVLKPTLKNKQGTIGSIKIRNVCARCNNGWMSLIETAAKQSLTSLIIGESILLNEEIRRNICNWIVLTCIMAEYTDLRTLAIPHVEKQFFYKEKSPPLTWKIWIGKYIGVEWSCRYRHDSFAIMPLIEAEKSINENRALTPNIQCSTMVWGQLFIYCVSIPDTEDINDYFLPENLNQKLCNIFPFTDNNVKSLSQTLSDQEANAISNHFLLHYAKPYGEF